MTIEIIMQVVGEGGSITLFGFQIEDNTWRFFRETKESMLADLLDRDDHDLLPLLVQKTDLINDWDSALKSISRYPWSLLHPKVVHPKFSLRIWKHLNSLEGPYANANLNNWEKICFLEHPLTTLVYWLEQSSNTLLITGAGCSVDAGIPDFRSKQGWWNHVDPRTVAIIEALDNNYKLFHDFYKKRIKHLATCSPHEGHDVISRWEKVGLIQSIATQNVDGFHQQVGNKVVRELHGSIRSSRCQTCGRGASIEQFCIGESCLNCGGKLRPNVVLFGEALSEVVWEATLRDIHAADLIIVIGTSLQVSPVNRLPFMTQGKVAIINLEETEEDDKFDLVIHGNARDILCELDKLLLGGTY